VVALVVAKVVLKQEHEMVLADDQKLVHLQLSGAVLLQKDWQKP